MKQQQLSAREILQTHSVPFVYGLVNSFQGTHTRATLTYFNSWDRLRIFFFARSVGVINIDVLILFILGATV